MSSIKFAYSHFLNSIKKKISIASGRLLSKPMQVSIILNHRCNARCLMCNFWKEKKDYLTADEIIKMIEDLNKLTGNNFFVQISGGEPLIFKGVYDIFAFNAQKGIKTKISTNGIALSEKTCDKIINSNLPFLSVSVDSHIPEIHDKFRGFKGAFKRSIDGLKYLHKNGNITLGISSIIMKDNISTFPESVDYFLSLPINRFLFQPIRVWTEKLPMSKWHEYEYWINDSKAIKRTSEHLLKTRKIDKRIFNSNKDIKDLEKYFDSPDLLVNSDTKVCNIGYDRLTIDYKGNVFTGCYYYKSIGNIKENNISDIWYSEQAKINRLKMRNCKIPCTNNCYKQSSLNDKIKKLIELQKSGLFKN